LGRHELWSLREDVQVELAPDGGHALLRSRWGDVTVQRPSSLVREALHRMCLGPISLENVIQDPARQAAARGRQDRADAAGDAFPGSEAVQWMRLYRVLERLQPLVIRSLGLNDGQPLLSVVPLTPRSRFRPVPLSPDVPVRLSTFATLRTDGTEYRLESPLSLHRVHLHRPEAISLVGALGQAITPAASAAGLPHGDPVVADALAYLAATGMVVVAEDAAATPAGCPPVFAEDNDQGLACWSATDLAFHNHSTFGRHDHDIGATYPRGEFRSAEPVVISRSAGPGIPLYRPTWEKLMAADPPLTVAIEGRRSTRSYGTAPVTAAELGELLYRTARVRSLSPAAAAGTARDAHEQIPDLSDRPYPGGGACYELELYVTVGRCAGIATGVYHYDPLGHRLEPVNADQATVDKLLSFACAAARVDDPPQVLLTLTARLHRLTWKYQGITYAVMLKHVGVLTQMLYLVAAAMRLAACALGSVNIDATAHAFGTDWRTEPSVGQFMIGSAPRAAEDHREGWLPANDASWPDRARAESAGQWRTCS
jgi:SagB-type dehydrogenase family enzyme